MPAKVYKALGDIPLMFEDEMILDRVMELYGQFQSRWQIRDILTAELELEAPISIITIGILISRAKAKIREQLKIKEPEDYKGRIIYCLEIILGGKAKYRDKLKALEMLAVYTGVDQQIQEDPNDYARRVAQAIKQMDASVGGISPSVGIGREKLQKEIKDGTQTQTEQAEGDRQEKQTAAQVATQTQKAGKQTDKEQGT